MAKYNQRELLIVVVMALMFISPFGLLWWSARGETLGDQAWTTGADWVTAGNGSVVLAMGDPFQEEATTTVASGNVSVTYVNANLYPYYEIYVRFQNFTGVELKNNTLDGVKWEFDFTSYGIDKTLVDEMQVRRGDYPDYYDAENKYMMDITGNDSAFIVTGSYDITYIDRITWPDTANITLYMKLDSVAAGLLSTFGGPIIMRYWFYSAAETTTGLDKSTVVGIEMLSLGFVGLFTSLIASEKMTWNDVRNAFGANKRRS